MNQIEFNYLATHIFAIVTHAFTIQCGEFGSAMQKEHQLSDAPLIRFDTEKHLKEFDFQGVLESGYRDLSELDQDFNEARSKANMDELLILFNELPQGFTPLNKEISGADLQEWIAYALKAEDDDALYKIHYMLRSLFTSEDDEIPDVIREAIAYDELEELNNIEAKLTDQHILVEDLITAATIESFSVLQWLIDRATLNDDELLQLVESQFQDLPVFTNLYEMLSLTNEQYRLILEAAEKSEAVGIIEFLHNNSVG